MTQDLFWLNVSGHVCSGDSGMCPLKHERTKDREVEKKQGRERKQAMTTDVQNRRVAELYKTNPGGQRRGQ